ncbi:MAG: carboxylating nicotinate-nucleotide diphosphorylase [Alphaproteobacteria bacterium]|nr:carboxylating nicotinate-nucleotide diphosphorylase [Alphaproteobacteria bacterium]
MSSPPDLPPLLYEDLVRAALHEDLGAAGDLTSDAIVGEGRRTAARIVARMPGRLAGIGVAAHVFRLLDGHVEVALDYRDGDDFDAGQLATVTGKARALLAAERTALNLLGRMCGIATATRDAVAEIAGTKARIVCTRKTMPGLRVLDKYAVRAGGGDNHRYGLHDAALVKDNHIAVAGGIVPAVEAVRAHVGHMTKVEVEVETLDQLAALIPLAGIRGVDAVLLDNMDPETCTRAVEMVDGCMLVEASGGVTRETVRAFAETGVDLISIGWLTHSVASLDVGLDIEIH